MLYPKNGDIYIFQGTNHEITSYNVTAQGRIYWGFTNCVLWQISCLQRSLFFCVHKADEYGKRDFCHGSKLTVLGTRGGYLATEPSRDTSGCVGSINNSGITIKECGGTLGHSQQTYHGARGLKSVIQGCGWRFDQSEFRPMPEVSFTYATQKEKGLQLAGNVANSKNGKKEIPYHWKSWLVTNWKVLQNRHQEPMTRSLHLHCVVVTAFSQTDLFLNRVNWIECNAKCWISIPYEPCER